jgi:hypothetical protein
MRTFLGTQRTASTLIVSLALLLIAALAQHGITAEPPASPGDLPSPFTAAEFRKHAAYLASDQLAGRAPGTDGSAKAARYVIDRFRECELKPLQAGDNWFQEFPLGASRGSMTRATGRNIVAVLPGRGSLENEAVIVTAHYDHLGTKPLERPGEDTIYNGADDNASGVSAILLVARSLANQTAALGASHRAVIFASFDAEERGLLGAHYYVQHPLWPLEKTAAVINFDGIGRLRMGKVFASDAETSPLLAAVVRQAARKRGLVAETRFGGHGRSDHAAFLDRRIPSMHFFTGANSDYHQVTDESNRLECECEGGAAIAWIGLQALLRAASYPGRIEFQKADPEFDMMFLLNLVQSFGVIPVLDTQEGRYPQILFVRAGSPAAEYGLKSGDEIAAINGLPFRRVEDGLTIFSQLNFADGVRVAVLRGGKKAEVTIPASVFEAMSGPKITPLAGGKFEVLFRYQPRSRAKAVYLAGEFNAWNPTADPMAGPDQDGVFVKRLTLPAGTYEYKFVVEGKEWISDPRNMYEIGKYHNSMLRVGPRNGR